MKTTREKKVNRSEMLMMSVGTKVILLRWIRWTLVVSNSSRVKEEEKRSLIEGKEQKEGEIEREAERAKSIKLMKMKMDPLWLDRRCLTRLLEGERSLICELRQAIALWDPLI